PGFWLRIAVLAACVAACVPGTYYDPSDRYVRGLRLFDRGSYDLALALWTPLAQEGDCDAQYRLGVAYFLSAGVSKDTAVAEAWWRRAAGQGQWRAQAMLATMYRHGREIIGSVARRDVIDCTAGCGLPRDNVEAFTWLRLASTGSDERAKKYISDLLDGLRESMTAEDVARAERQTTDRKPLLPCSPRRLL